jgi:UDP-N-acetylmuramate--L-alanine ligase/UDP-N-acetylenolpyruvoylglucosamine reductase
VTVHFVGIGGIGMSGIARVLHGRGVDVSGCDRSDGPALDALRALGINCTAPHDQLHADRASELVISGAIPDDEPEVVRARALGIPVRHRADALAGILAGHRRRCVVTGAHGKTTTSAMIAVALDTLGLEPSYVVGGDIRQLGGNAAAGNGDICVAEGDESDRSVTRLPADVAVILNVDLDHLDHYASVEEVVAELASWTARLPADGVLVCGDGVDVPAPRAVRFGVGPGEGLRALEIGDGPTGVRFRPSRGCDSVQLHVSGVHNAGNACAAALALEELGVPLADAFAALQAFRGTGRRYELVGERDGFRVVDDYAHHPAELAATLAAARAVAHASVRRGVRRRPRRRRRRRADGDVRRPRHARSRRIRRRHRRTPGDPRTRARGDVRADLRAIDRRAPCTCATRRPHPLLRRGAGRHRRARGGGPMTRPEIVEEGVPLARLTTIGTGGPARYLARPHDVEALQACLAWAAGEERAVRVVGLGSNLLPADAGYDGLVLRLEGALAQITLAAPRVHCGGGASLAAVVRRTRDAGLSGIEFGCAIPGTVGGAVRMNAGAYEREMREPLAEAVVVSARGVRRGGPAALEMAYRHSNVADDEVVASAVLLLEPADPVVIAATIRAMQDRRSAAQPRKARTFGSIFKNPPGDRTSGQLIEACGLKGFVVGGARISPKHANFIENTGGATSADVVALMAEARRRVRERFGVALEHEVELLGAIALPDE